MVDICQGGGQRLDVEMLSRAVNKWRSDADSNGGLLQRASEDQLFTLSLSHFFPLHAGSIMSSEPYIWRSSATTGGVLWWNVSDPKVSMPPAVHARTEAALAESHRLRPLLLSGDFFNLTEVPLGNSTGLSPSTTVWTAWQIASDSCKGAVWAFRREHAAPSTVLSLRNVQPTRRYSVTFSHNFSTTVDDAKVLTGAQLQQLSVELSACSATGPGCAASAGQLDCLEPAGCGSVLIEYECEAAPPSRLKTTDDESASYHVSRSGHDGASCGQTSPCRTIAGALASAGSGPSRAWSLRLDDAESFAVEDASIPQGVAVHVAGVQGASVVCGARQPSPAPRNATSCEPTSGWIWKSTGNDTAAGYHSFRTNSSDECCGACERDGAKCSAWMLQWVKQLCTLRTGPVRALADPGGCCACATTTGQLPPSPSPGASTAPCFTVVAGGSMSFDGVNVQVGAIEVQRGGNVSIASAIIARGKAPAIVALAGGAASHPPPRVELRDYRVPDQPHVVPVVISASSNARVIVAPFPRPPPTLPIPRAKDAFKGWSGPDMGKGCNAYPSTVPTTKRLLKVAADGSGDYRTVQAAVAAVPEGGRTGWEQAVTIQVAAGVFNETVCINRLKGFVRLIGAGASATSIVRAQGSVNAVYPPGFCAANSSRCTCQGPDGCWPSCGVVRVLADDVKIQDLTVHNPEIGSNHNVALQVLGERMHVLRSALIGGGDATGFLMAYQHDTSDPSRGQYLLEDSYIEGHGPDILCLLVRALSISLLGFLSSRSNKQGYCCTGKCDTTQCDRIRRDLLRGSADGRGQHVSLQDRLNLRLDWRRA